MTKRKAKFQQEEVEVLPPDSSRESWLVRFSYTVRVDHEQCEVRIEVEVADGEWDITNILDEDHDVEIDVGELDGRGKQVEEILLEAKLSMDEYGAF